MWWVLVQFWRCLHFWTHLCSDYRTHASGNLNCCRGSSSLRKEGRPFHNGNGEESFSTTFSHPTRQILIRVPLSVWGASRSPALGTLQCCWLLPGTLRAGCGDPPLDTFPVLNSVNCPSRSTLGSFSSPAVAPLLGVLALCRVWGEGLQCAEMAWLEGLRKHPLSRCQQVLQEKSFPAARVHWFWWYYYLECGKNLVQSDSLLKGWPSRKCIKYFNAVKLQGL